MIEQFASSHIYIAENKNYYTMEIQGSVKQAYFSKLMMDAIVSMCVGVLS